MHQKYADTVVHGKTALRYSTILAAILIYVRFLFVFCSIFCSVDKRHVLLKAGHRGVCCYFIFSGSLFVNIQEQEDDSEGGSGTGRSYYRTLCVLRTGDLVGVSGRDKKIIIIVCRKCPKFYLKCCCTVLPKLVLSY